MEELVTITVDGRQIQAPKGELLWEVCKAHGIEIPIFCYHTKLGPVGACRTCMVEQAGVAKGPITACSTPITDGMVIRTKSAVVEKAQRGIFEFLLANHPLDCPICDRAGECPLQDQTFAHGPGTSRYIEPKRHHVKPIVLGPTIALDRERCVLCWRCVRFCADIAEDNSIVLLDRGDHSMVGTFQGEPYISNFSGNVVELCPVGALTSRKQRFGFRAWELQNRPSVCPHCPMGCNINVSVRKNDEVIRFLSRDNPEVDNSWLCDKGRYGFTFINSDDRLKSPMIRRNGTFVQTSWTEALEYIAQRLTPIIEEFGSDTVAGFASPRLTNEDLFVFKRFMSQVIGSTNIDHFPRSALMLTGPQREKLRQLDETLTSISALNEAKTILLLGADPGKRAPVLELRIREAVNKHDAKLAVVNAEEISLTSKAHARLSFAQKDFAPLVRMLEEAVSGRRSSGADDLTGLTRMLAEGPTVVIYDDAFEGIEDKGDALDAVADFVRALAQSGVVGTLPLLDDCNSMGARDLGIFPGDQAWGPSLLSSMKSRSQAFKAAFVLGSNLARDGERESIQALRALDFLVVHDLTFTDTAKLADVVLPAASFAEKRGTFTNLERRIQVIEETIPPPGIARADWEILVDLSQHFERPMEYAQPEDIWVDLGATEPAYRGLSASDIGPRGIRPKSLQLV